MSPLGPVAHESAEKHVTGESVFVDDIPVDGRLLVGHVVYSPHARARIASFDLTEARTVDGVYAVLSARDIPGHNQMGPVVKDEVCLGEGEVTFVGQAVFLIAGDTAEQCREAARRIQVSYEPLEPVLTIEKAIERGTRLGPSRTMKRGDPDSALRNAPHRFGGVLRTGAAEHWYLETQACLCVPGEGTEINVFSSTQHPSETQALIAEVLGIPRTDVVVEVRRIGGAFGGKETQANHTACWAALLCRATGRPVKIRLSRDDDMIMTGKRHRYLTRYEAGFDDDGRLLALKLEFNSDGGAATDLSFAIMERTMLHADNAYFVPNMEVVAHVWKTNLPSNTAMRGFGAPQAMAAMETVIDRVARALRLDPAEVRRRNFYGAAPRNITHYGQTIRQNHLALIDERLMTSSEYQRRRADAEAFNAASEFVKRGLAMTPVKFGISFTTTFLNQAGALVHCYTDGTVLVNHGGTEMGQGLNTKIQQIAAAEFGLPLDRVKVNATNTSRVPNTSATAASSGTDLNGMAVKNAVDMIKARVAPEIAAVLSEGQSTATDPGNLIFAGGSITDGVHPERRLSFADAMAKMHLRRVSLSAAGYYRTPEIGWDKIAGVGQPFFYYAYGMAVSEVQLDTLTGTVTVLRTDILHDVGDSLNPAIDRGQIEGGFIQGLGWCLLEEIKWDDAGHLLTHSSDTYKIPTARDVPRDLRITLLDDVPNPGTIGKSKAVGEPPLMLAFSVWLAVKDAVSSVANHTIEPEFDLPATPEAIVLSVEKLRTASNQRRGSLHTPADA